MKFRFSIRDVLLLTLIVAMVIGWNIDHRKMDNEITKIEKSKIAILDLLKSKSGYAGMALALDDGTLYRVDYPLVSFGGKASAYSLSDGKLLWKTELKAIGPVRHFGYSNEIFIHLQGGSLEVVGHESAGDYVEMLDCKTGNMISNRVYKKDFSQREDYKQNEPK
jgi:hypothetical protein